MGGNQAIIAARGRSYLVEKRESCGLGPNYSKGHEEDFGLNPVSSGKKLLPVFEQGNTRRMKGKAGKALTTSGNQNPSCPVHVGSPRGTWLRQELKSELRHLLTLNLDRLLTSSVPQFPPL